MKKIGFQFKFRGTSIYASFSDHGKKFYESLNIPLESVKHFDLEKHVLTTSHRGYEQDNKKLHWYESKIRNWILEAETNSQNSVDYVKTKLNDEKLLEQSKLLDNI